MSYKVIEINEYGVLVIDNDKHKSMSDICSQCKYCDICNDEWMECIINTYYLPDSEVERLESENDLKAKIEELESRIKEMEKTIENNVTELIHRTGDLTHDFWYFCQECGENFEMDHGFNYCPNCGRKILR